MSVATVTAVTGLIGVFSLVAKEADRYNISAPMVFITIGIFVGLMLKAAGEPVVGNGTESEIVLIISEITLIIILFHDASTINFKELYISIPLRLLTLGLSLTLILLYFTTRALLPDIGVYGALLVAAALTPTDAGLGAPTILNLKVPSRIRQALNVESGLNDGMITPIVLIALAGLEKEGGGAGPDIPRVALVPISIAIALALVTAPLFSMALGYTHKTRLSTHAGRSTAIVMYPIMMWALSLVTGANGFIASFVAGGIFGAMSELHHSDHAMSELLEAVADFFNDIAWFLAGELIVFVFGNGFKWEWVLIAFLALVPFRMIPVYISLLGTGLDFTSMSFLGWFGPRGIATVIFALLQLESLETTQYDDDDRGEDERKSAERRAIDILGSLLFTVVVSVFAHGYSASPLAEAYAKDVAAQKESAHPSTIDLNPADITVRTRGQAKVHSLPPELLHARSLNMNRLRSETDARLDRRASEQFHVRVNENGSIDGESIGVEMQETEEDPDAMIHLPYTKTANTTLIRRGSLRVETEGPLIIYDEKEDSKHLSAVMEASSESYAVGERGGVILLNEHSMNGESGIFTTGEKC